MLTAQLNRVAKTNFPGTHAFLKGMKPRLVNWVKSPGSAGDVFAGIYEGNQWGDEESVSGPGSNMEQTAVIREAIPALLAELGVKVMLDAPCGDFYWMKTLDLGVQEYIGLDIVEALVESNQAQYGGEGRRFMTGDIIEGELPEADLVLCRDCFEHLTLGDAKGAIRNFRKAGVKYLLATTYPSVKKNLEGVRGQWRSLNLSMEPLGLGAPMRLIDEGGQETDGSVSDKSLGLWKL